MYSSSVVCVGTYKLTFLPDLGILCYLASYYINKSVYIRTLSWFIHTYTYTCKKFMC